MDAVSEPTPAAYLSFAEARRVITGILLAMFLAALNQTIVATALPTIGRDLDDFENLSWTVTAYLLTSTVVASLYGKLSDIHGRRAMMLTAVGIFVAGSTVCALAPNMIVLVLGRGLQGLGGGGIMPLAQVIVADVSPPRERGRYQAYLGIVWVGAGIGGPVVGGFIAEHLAWPLIFWINVPLGIAAAYLTNAALKRLPRNDRWHALDLLGAGLMMAGAVSLLLALTWGGTRYPWASPQIAGLFACAVAFAAAFRWRIARAPEPYLPLPILRNPVVRMGAASSACAIGASIGLTVFMPFYYQLVHKLSVSESGLALIPIAVMTTPGSIMAGRAMMFLRHYKRVSLVCLTLAIAAVVFLAWRPTSSPWLAIAVLALVGTGVGSVFPLSTVCIQNAVQAHQMGTATGVMNFFRALFASLVVAIMGAIMLAGFGVAADRGRGAEALIAAGTAAGDAADVFRWVFAAAAAFLALGLVALIRLPERPLRGGSGRPAK
ncbi:MAG TPA: MDR family MFS transporter [Xanthobacteraceae bacterium]|nr:MDR family MFS transporter [Xanthobacteraceae bacterium]